MSKIYKMSYKHRSHKYNHRIRFLVLHYTALDFKTSIDVLTNKFSVHYLVPDPKDKTYDENDLKVFNLVDENDRGWHAGLSSWENRSNLNDQSIGIEIVNQAYDDQDGIHFVPYNEQQIDAVINLSKNIIERYPDITAKRVVAHSDISPDRKSDPGPLFPWEKLYQNGIGAWYDEKTKNKYVDIFNHHGLPSMERVQRKLSKYGYKINISCEMDHQTMMVLRAFQMHFRPKSYDGRLDIETVAILEALVEKY